MAASAAAWLFLASLAPAAAEVETVEGIAVDERAADADAARTKAFAKAGLVAVRTAMRRAGWSGSAKADAKAADAAVVRIEVADERIGPDSYAATLVVGVDLARLSPGAGAKAPAGTPVLVPLRRTAFGTRFADLADPWIAAFVGPKAGAAEGFAPRLADPRDKPHLPAGPETKPTAAALEKLAARYGGGPVALAVLDSSFADGPQSAAVLEVAVWSEAGGLRTARLWVPGPDAAAAARPLAIDAARAMLARGAEGATAAGTVARGSVLLAFETADWGVAEAALRATPGVSAALARPPEGGRLFVEVTYAGTEAELRRALGARGVAVGPGMWPRAE